MLKARDNGLPETVAVGRMLPDGALRGQMGSRFSGVVLALVVACSTPNGSAPSEPAPPALPVTKPAPDAATEKVAVAVPVVSPYEATSRRIIEESLKGYGAWEKLSVLTDRIGARLSGSPALERAVVWARDRFVSEGHANVRLEPVRVPHWERGRESAEMLTPVPRTLSILGLGGSVGTGGKAITASVVTVSSFEELEQLGSSVSGKVVLFNHAMVKTGETGKSYGDAVIYRVQGAARAAPFGAVAVLVRSLTTRSLGAPHTGAMRYAEAVPGQPGIRKIPAASISVEDAELIARLTQAGEDVTVRLALGARSLPDAESANVVAELVGREKPDEIVLLGAHLDSWDVGQGAQDNGAGCVIVMEALSTLRRLGLTPKRTLRAVLFTNEENGARGAAQYAADHAAEAAWHVAAFETDFGAGPPLGFMTNGPQPFLEEANVLASVLAPVGANHVTPGYAGEDILRLEPFGVPLFGLALDGTHYFDVHHSVADTLDKVDPLDLQRSVAAMAAMVFMVADRPDVWRSSVADSVPLTTVPLTTVPLTTVPLTTVPLTTVPLTTVPLTTVPLTTVPLTPVSPTPVPPTVSPPPVPPAPTPTSPR